MPTATANRTASARAGRYLVQPTGYRAFVPAPLPPSPALCVEGELQGLLSQADLALGRPDGWSLLTVPDPNTCISLFDDCQEPAG